MASKGGRVTALDVARAANVSKTTVSYVLNDTPHQSIPEETRQRVLEAVRELSYTPLATARALRRGHNDTVLLVMPDWPLGRVLSLVLDDLTGELANLGLALLMRRIRKGQSLAAICREVAPAAVIALGHVDEVEQQEIRGAGIFLSTAVLSYPSSTQNTVSVPQDLIGSLQVQHLAARGHRHLGYAGPADPRFEAFRDLRISGARQACQELGLDDPDVLELDLTLEAAMEAVRHWHHRTPSVTAIIAYNDEFAAAILAGMRAAGLSAPEDLAVIGVDNEPLAKFTIPALTTIDQKPDVVAAHLAQVVRNGISGKAAPKAPRTEALELVIRESA
jgi:DNA-binding LacI/PurR family transcriptional regulator